MKLPKIESEGNKKIISLLTYLKDGTLRVPRFQRDFVWERRKIVALLDSIYKEYPIGSFFLWATTGKYNLFYRDLPELGITPAKPRIDEKLKFILDGQQRICSLYAAWYGMKVEFKDGNKTKLVDCSQICLDLDYYKKEPDDGGNQSVFEVKRESERYVPLYKVLGEGHLQLFRTLTPERQEVFNECYQIFTTYPLSVVTVFNVELNNASVIFERINQGGKKLSLFDLVVASTWGEDFDLKENYIKLRQRISSKGFGDITPEVVTHTISLILKGFCNKIYQLQLKQKEIKENWDEIANAIEQSVEHLSANLGVRIFEFTPYPSFIPLLAYLYFKTEGRALTKEMTDVVHEWFWKAALSERYTSSMESKMGEDRREIFDKLLNDKEVNINFTITADEEKIANTTIGTKSALRNAIFCMLARRNPRHFKTNDIIPMDHKFYSSFNSPEKHHIFPKRYLSRNKIGGENLIANFCFIPAELNKEILDQKPSDYFAGYQKENTEFSDTLQTHLLTYSDAIKEDNYRLFIKERAEAIKREFERLTGSKIIQILGVNANKALDDIEMKLRLLINSQLTEKVGKDYWNQVIPGDIRGKVKIKIAEYLRKNPYITAEKLDSYDRLCQCDVMNYSNIILKNWEYFEPFFGSKYETEKRFITLKDFRNAVKHIKEINFVLQKEAEAAIEWFSQVLRGVKGEEDNVEETKISVSQPPEINEEIIARVKSDFVKQAVDLIPRWIEKEYSDGKLYIKRGNSGSHRSIKQGEKLILFYYYANKWVYGELQMTTPEELKSLKENLSKPESIFDRQGRYKQVRFHIMNKNDLELILNIIRKRIE
ncbi:DUF262 domain-containing protein [Patescibacteria group bacterium]|nr:DUF262 domain-containing protein [Patescibacteria group bacterium]